MDFSERRKYTRLPLVMVVSAEISREKREVLLLELSEMGARILSQFPLSAGDRITMKIPLSSAEPVVVTGKFVWIDMLKIMKGMEIGMEYMAGIQFDRENREIRDFVKVRI